MRKSLVSYDSSNDPSPSSSSSSSQFHSLITAHSHTSASTDSSPPSPTRCFGLNLLVKAIHQITAGSVVGVPYIQKRVITRRRRPLHFTNLILTTTELLNESRSRSKPKAKLRSKGKRQRRVNMAMPLKYRDSVLDDPIDWKLR